MDSAIINTLPSNEDSIVLAVPEPAAAAMNNLKVALRGRLDENSTRNGRFFESAMCWKFRSVASRSDLKLISSASTVTVPDSIFDRSRMSLMSVSRSAPDP